MIEFFDDTRLDKITTSQVEAYKQRRTTGADKVDKVTCNSELNDLSAILKYARHLKLPCATPAITRYRVRKKKGNAKPFTRTEVGFILDAAASTSDSFHALVKFLAETGARRSEGINLPWTRVSLADAMARIWSDAEGEAEEGDDEYEVKSVEREVTLSDGLVRVLKKQKLRAGDSPWVFPVMTNRASRNGKQHTKGDRYAEWPKHTWGRVTVKATDLALAADPNAREIDGGPHRLRHTFASEFLSRMPDLFALAKIMGHSHSRVTELYAHFLPDHLAKTRNVVVYEQAPKTPPKTPPKKLGGVGRTG